jgi:hypothetical protein
MMEIGNVTVKLNLDLEEWGSITIVSCQEFDCINNHEGLCNLKSIFIKQGGGCSRWEVKNES